MTMLMIWLQLIIELKTIQAITFLVSMSAKSWQSCLQPPRVLFSPVCCKQDKTQKGGELKTQHKQKREKIPQDEYPECCVIPYVRFTSWPSSLHFTPLPRRNKELSEKQKHRDCIRED